MASNTTNYNLVKPAQEDFYDIAVFNSNMDVIDTTLKGIADSAAASIDSSSATFADLKALYDEGKSVNVRYNGVIYTAISSSDSEMKFVATSTDTNGDIVNTILTLSSAGSWSQSSKVLVSEETFNSHTHDDRYYTETETNSLLASKSDTSHTHDDRYYTESEISTLLSAKAAKSTSTTATLYYSSWTDTAAPYSYTLSISGVTTTSVQEILPSTSITQAQLEALQAANIQDAGQTSGKIYLKAWGEKPTINIPIRIIKRGDI